MSDQDQITEIALIKQEQKSMSEKIDDLSTLVKGEFKSLKKELICMREDNDEKYVSNDKFQPVKSIVYGMVAVILLAFATGLVALIIK